MTSIEKHPDYKKEVTRLEETKKYFAQFIKNVTQDQKTYESEIRQAFIDLDYLDSSQSYITILINAKFMDYNKENLKKVKKAINNPYFCRIDFREKESSEVKEYYIGKLSLLKENNEPLVIDWRAPVAELYYEGRLGEVSYETDTDTVEGELSLKRQYTINNGELEEFFDVDITTNDEFLQSYIGAHADNRLKDIVATIQSEQNKIIRADLEKPLIVQGAAGSGKTTIALHRIAYLIYTYEETFIPENFMILAPNSLFLNYISEVLPELDVERVKQTTFTNFCFELLGKNFNLKNPDDKLVFLLQSKNTSQEQELTKWLASFKGSLVFKGFLDNYIKRISKEMLPQEDFILEGYTIASLTEIQDLFLVKNSYLPVFKRLEQIKKNLSLKLKKQKDEILDEIATYYDSQIDSLRSNMEDTEERRLKIVSLMDTRDEKIEKINKSAKTAVKNYLKKFTKKDYFTYYKKLLTNKDLFQEVTQEYLNNEKVDFLINNSSKTIKKKILEFEDLAPLLYLKAKLEGFKEDITVNNVVIDEAQDYSPFQLVVLQDLLNTTNFTILGDLSQGIYSYQGIENWEDVRDKVFDVDCSYLTLKRTYRTTIDIMNLANKIIKLGTTNDETVLAKPVVRHGEKPGIEKYNSEEQLLENTSAKITEFKNQNFVSIAVITKTLEECRIIKEYLDSKGYNNVHLLTGEEEEYEGGTIILPSYLAKGLEFDSVIIVNINESYEKNPLDTKLLYVSITRAMHKLHINYMNNTIPLLEEIT